MLASRPRILVVDDEPRALELLVRSLRRVGEVVTASSADAAQALHSGARFDLVISDQRMPGSTGVELLSRIAESDENVGRILLTGYTDLETSVEAINRGRVHAYLHKPCSTPDLMATVAAVLQRVGLARENQRLLAVVSEQNAQLGEALESLQRAQDKLVGSERLAAIGRMGAMIVHDLRGPLAAIRSAGEEVRREGTERAAPALGELGREVLDEAARLERMCSELLEIARASELPGVLRRELIDDAVATALAALSHEASLQGVEIELDLHADVLVAIDEQALRRALHNLARNAFEAMPEGGRLLVRSVRDGDHAVLTLTDSGPGIAAEIAGRLFEPFATFGKPAGCGLGLAVVRKVVEDLDGTISVAKAEGGGACFEIRLPLAFAADS
ncbi:MAG: response regulator [Deltaproteobacteria bacterium]|nr:response regulator [Deltaproteobacteria bacterium]